MKITATDADDPDTKNAQIAFKIVSQDPSQPEAFTINRATGEVRTARFQLDREVFFLSVLCLLVFYNQFALHYLGSDL